MSNQDRKQIIALPPEVEERMRPWAESPEGSRAIDEALASYHETIRRLQEARKVNWRDLHKPIDI